LDGCDNLVNFVTLGQGYRLCCCHSHATKHPLRLQKYRESKRLRFGDEHYGDFGSTRFKEAMIEKYGEDNIFKTEYFQEMIKPIRKEIDIKKKQTCLRNYGEVHYMKTVEGKENFTFKKDEMKENYIRTCQERYGLDFYTQVDEFKLDRYNKARQTWKNKSPEELEEMNKKRMAKKVETGTVVPEDLLSAWELYRRLVNRVTRIYMKQVYFEWDGLDYYSKEFIKDNVIIHGKGTKYGPSIDHKISKLEGFLTGISAEVIGYFDNLCITQKYLNSHKRCKNEKQFLQFLENRRLKDAV
jgi:hypothetical protein